MTTTTWIPADTFGARLVLARRQLGLTVEEAAERCGIHHATWSTWERGVATPREYPFIVREISDALGVDPNWLSNGGALAPPERRRPVSSNRAKNITNSETLRERLLSVAA